MQEPNDKDLVKRCLSGDLKAFEILLERYQKPVYNVALRLLSNTEDAADVTQATFVRAYEKLNSYDSRYKFFSWLYRIAVNTAKNYLVSKGRRPPSLDVDMDDAELAEDTPALRDIDTPDANLEKEYLQRVINQAIEDLPEDLRTAFTLREFSGLSYEDITEIMDCPVGTVRSRIFRAREAIDRKIRELL